MDEVKAENLHELMRVAEIGLVALSGNWSQRQPRREIESRMGSAHVRGDYPAMMTDHFHGSMIHLKKRAGDTRSEDTPFAPGPTTNSLTR